MLSFDIEELAVRAGVSKTSIYNLISKNKAFVKQNSTKKQRKVLYNEAVLAWILDYYDKDTEQEAATKQPEEKSQKSVETPQEAAQEASAAPDETNTQEDKDAIIEALRAQISTLEAEVQSLKEQLDRESAHCTELIRQNSIAWMTINKEKQEKVMLLPAPKKPISVAIHDFFHQLRYGKAEEPATMPMDPIDVSDAPKNEEPQE